MTNLSKNSVVTITGGTGSFGSTMVKTLIEKNVAEIRIFSRDENKQDNLRNELKDSRVKFFIGDTRDLNSVENVIKGSDYVFHAAALKQVPSCEFFPIRFFTIVDPKEPVPPVMVTTEFFDRLVMEYTFVARTSIYTQSEYSLIISATVKGLLYPASRHISRLNCTLSVASVRLTDLGL